MSSRPVGSTVTSEEGKLALRDAAVIVVNFGSSDLLAENLDSLPVNDGLQVVVVDNLTGTAEQARIVELAAANHWRSLLVDHNSGFGAGVNAGIRLAVAHGCTRFLVVNPDAVVPEAAVRELLAASARDAQGLISPRIVDGGGAVWFDGACLDLGDGRTGRSGAFANGVEWVSGACFAATTEMWDRVGGFDEEFFLYWEDVDLSWRWTRCGGSLSVLGETTVRHDVGGTQNGVAGAKSSTYVHFNCRNRLLFAGRHLDRVSVRAWRRSSLRYAWEVVRRGGGKRGLLRRPSLIWAAITGTIAGWRLTREHLA